MQEFQTAETTVMAKRNNANDDALLQQVIELMRYQEIPEFPDPEIAVPKSVKRCVSSVQSTDSIYPLRRTLINRCFQLSAGAIIGLAAMLGFLMLWGGGVTQSASAMEKMAEKIRQVKSCKCTEKVKITHDSPKPGRRLTWEATYTTYRQLPGASRSEVASSRGSWKGPGPERICIYPVGKPSIYIHDPTKTFRRYPPLCRGANSSPFDRLEDLGKYSSSVDRELGTKEINGRKANGFQIDMKKMHPDARGSMAEIWLDQESNLPVFVRYKYKGLESSTICEVSDIQWNIDLDQKLFDTTPPKGYKDITPKPLPLQRQVCHIVDSLKIYAQASGGHYPSKDVSYIDTTEDLCRLLSVKEWPGGKEEGNAGIAAKASSGFEQIGTIDAYNPDYAYYGKTVKPSDKDKVLLRWRLDDGRYQVVYGDLRAETVTAERLRALEGK